MYITERLRQGVDPDNIPETEQAMDFGAEEIDRKFREATKMHDRCLAEIRRLEAENQRLRQDLVIYQTLRVAEPPLLSRLIWRLRAFLRD